MVVWCYLNSEDCFGSLFSVLYHGWLDALVEVALYCMLYSGGFLRSSIIIEKQAKDMDMDVVYF
jgi:hypothetical protein